MFTGYFIDQEPSPILVLQPTLDMGQSFAKDRLDPMIRDTPALQGKIKEARSRDSGNTIMHKKFLGGHVTISATNSLVSLASRPIRVLLCDDVESFTKLGALKQLAERTKSEIAAASAIAGDGIKYVSVSGNTISFWKDAAHTGTADFTMDFPTELFLDQTRTTFEPNFGVCQVNCVRYFFYATFGKRSTNLT